MAMGRLRHARRIKRTDAEGGQGLLDEARDAPEHGRRRANALPSGPPPYNYFRLTEHRMSADGGQAEQVIVVRGKAAARGQIREAPWRGPAAQAASCVVARPSPNTAAPPCVRSDLAAVARFLSPDPTTSICPSSAFRRSLLSLPAMSAPSSSSAPVAATQIPSEDIVAKKVRSLRAHRAFAPSARSPAGDHLLFAVPGADVFSQPNDARDDA